MRIRYTTAFGAPKGSIQPGEEAEVSAEQAERLIAKGFAEPIASSQRETATSRKAASADKRKASKKKGK